MKFLIITLTAVLSFLGTSTRAADAPTAIVTESFSQTFQSASEVKWSTVNGMYKAEFTYNARIVAAYYDVDGTLIATTRNLSALDLPLSLQKSLKKEAEGAWISELFEVSEESGTAYYVTLETADRKIVLKSGSASWSSYRKINK
jgi:hypothetical protein